MTDQEAVQLADDLDFTRRIRRRLKNTLVARMLVCLVWGFVLAVAGFVRDLGGNCLWLLMPLVAVASLGTMIFGARLRHNSGELTISMDRKTSIHWAISGLAVLAVLLASAPGDTGALLLLGTLAASHLVAGIILETSYLFTAGTLSAAMLLWILYSSGLPTANPGMLAGLVAWVCLVLGALLAKAVYRHGR